MVCSSCALFMCCLAALMGSSCGQNFPPQWVKASYEVLEAGISEATPLNTVVATLECSDPEGDTVLYRKLAADSFDVDLRTGDVKLVRELDAEIGNSAGIPVEFGCIDVIEEPDGFEALRDNWVSVRLNYGIDDANDNRPIFETPTIEGYVFFVPEDAEIGSRLLPSFTVRDIDSSQFAILSDLTFICESTDQDVLDSLDQKNKEACDKFGVTFEQGSGKGVYLGTIYLTGVLDYETNPVYITQLVAWDGLDSSGNPFTSQVNVQFAIEDAQDTLPDFTNPGESVTISEGTQEGTTVSFGVSARDGDLGAQRRLEFDIIEDPYDSFALAPALLAGGNTEPGVYTAKLIVRNKLDREEVDTAYVFTAKVYEMNDTADPPIRTDATATATYSVFVSDINDNSPVFTEDPYSVETLEFPTFDNLADYLPVQIANLHIICEDKDEPSNSGYQVSIIDQTFPEAFSISPAGLTFTGRASMFLQVNNPTYMDFDIPAYQNQTIVLMAREVNTFERFSSTTTILLYLADLNDNNPVFTQPSYEFGVLESVVPPYKITTFSATDDDSGDKGKIQFRIEDGNDSLFEMDQVSGSLTLVGPLDFEDTQQYSFLAYVQDSDPEKPLSSQVQVIINVLNVNDQGPEFKQPSYQTSANETSKSFLNTIFVRAVDDEDPNAQITYSIIDGQSENNAFFINAVSGELTLREFLDYQTTPLDADGNRLGYFTLTVQASDNGVPPQTNNVEVKVNVIDENNHKPILDPVIYDVQLPETAQPGTFVADIEGSDADSGSFGKITYRLGAGNSGNFLVNAESGVVRVSGERNFDFDTRPSYQILILATDGGAPQKTATATINVDLLDRNTKPPTFSGFLYRANVDENRPVGTSVLRVAATDEDKEDANLQYSIIRSSYTASDKFGNSLLITDFSNAHIRDLFVIERDGNITINAPLDMDVAQEISFDVMVEDVASDTGTQIATTRVALIIQGEPDSEVVFDPLGITFVNEDQSINYDIGTFSARDLLTDKIIQNYVKLPGSSDSMDVVRETGKVLLKKLVDYEDITQREHLIIVRGSITDDQGTRSATSTMTVSVLDANDNAPQFSRPSYVAQLSESAEFPDLVTRINARDEDSSSFGPIVYHITGGLAAEDFMIFQAPNDDSGADVLVARGKKLDFNRREKYVLTIVAVDNPNQLASSTRMTSAVSLTIDLIDENNNVPYFKEVSPFVTPETTPTLQDIAVIQAFDDDKFENGRISYSLETGSSANGVEALTLFDISSSTGNIFVKTSLLGRGGITYHFVVRAEDNGEVPSSATMPVEITILSTEDNDGNPKWKNPPTDYMVLAPEETDNVELTELQALYDVVPRTGLGITYALSRYSDAYESLSIDETSGLVTIVHGLDRERQEYYTIQVFAQDTNDTLRLRSGRSFIIRLTDKDDNLPTFTNPKDYLACPNNVATEVTIPVEENVAVNSTLFRLRACDPDGPGNNEMEFKPYILDDPCRTYMNESIFEVQSNGQVIATDTVNYEQQQVYVLCVLVQAPDKPQNRTLGPEDRPDVALVTVNILDVNDNTPKFPSSTAVATVATNPGSGTVHVLDAVDKDGPGYSSIRYVIERSEFFHPDTSVGQLIPNAFELQGSTGAIFPKMASYASYLHGHFILKIVAYDRLDNSKSDTQRLYIYVYDKYGDTMKLVLDQSPDKGLDLARDLIDALDHVDGQTNFAYISASENRLSDGVNTDKTDVCFVAVESNTKTVLDIRAVLSILNSNKYQDVLGEDVYHFEDRGKCYPSRSSEDEVDWDDLWWVLVAVAIFLFVCCLICIILAAVLYNNYKNYMDTRKTYLVEQ